MQHNVSVLFLIAVRCFTSRMSRGERRRDESNIAYTVFGWIDVLPYALVESTEDDLFPKTD